MITVSRCLPLSPPVSHCLQLSTTCLSLPPNHHPQSPKDPGTAAGAYGVFFDMTSTAGKLQVEQTQELLGSLGTPIVTDEAEDMLRHAQGEC